MGRAKSVINDQLLRLSYSDPKNIRKWLKSWGLLEELSRKGNTVATCILVDFKMVTGIDIEKYHRYNRKIFNELYKN